MCLIHPPGITVFDTEGSREYLQKHIRGIASTCRTQMSPKNSKISLHFENSTRKPTHNGSQKNAKYGHLNVNTLRETKILYYVKEVCPRQAALAGGGGGGGGSALGEWKRELQQQMLLASTSHSSREGDTPASGSVGQVKPMVEVDTWTGPA